MHYTGWADYKEFASRAAERGAEGGGIVQGLKPIKGLGKLCSILNHALEPACSHESGEKVDPRE